MSILIRPIPPGERQALAGMTFPSYQHLLDPANPLSGRLICLAAVDSIGTTTGLLMAHRESSQHGRPEEEVTFLSLFVTPSQRRRGIGTALMEHCLALCRTTGIRKVEATWTDKPCSRPIENIMARTGWSPPALRMLSGKLNLADTLNHPDTWCVPVSLPKNGRYLPWHEVTREQRAKLIISQAESAWIPDDLFPLRVESLGPVEPHSSIALEIDGEIAGWSLPHALRPGLVRGTASFVRADLQPRGRMIGLMHESFTRAIRAGFTTGVWTTPLHHAHMIALIHRRIGPISEYVRETRGSHCLLQAGS